MRENVNKYCRAGQTTDDNILETRLTNTNQEYVMLITFPLQKCLHERALILRYTYLDFPIRMVNHVKHILVLWDKHQSLVIFQR